MGEEEGGWNRVLTQTVKIINRQVIQALVIVNLFVSVTPSDVWNELG